jgi:hypothetical protein
LDVIIEALRQRGKRWGLLSDLILRRREAPSRRWAAREIVVILRDAVFGRSSG